MSELMDEIKALVTGHIKGSPHLSGHKYYNEPVERMPRERIEELQWKLVKLQIRRAYELTPFYHRRLKEAGIKPEDIKTMEDFQKIPTVVKDDVREEMKKTGDPFGGCLAVPFLPSKILNIYSSTGTTGLRTFNVHTEWDRDWCLEAICRISVMELPDALPGSVFVDFGFHWHGGITGTEMGVSRLGMMVAPMEALGPGFELERCWQVLQFLKPISIHWPLATLWIFGDWVQSVGKDPKETMKHVKLLSTSGDVLTNAAAEFVKDYWGFEKVHSGFQMADTWITGCNCPAQPPNITHIWDDFHYVEAVDPETGEPVAPGERGLLVITPLVMEAIPHLRWNNEDYVSLIREECDCGRTHTRLRWYGREAFAVNVKGRKVFPSEVEDDLFTFPEIGVNAIASQFVKTAEESQEKLIIRVAYFPDKVKDLDKLKAEAEGRIREKLGLDVEIEFLAEDELKSALTAPHKFARLTKRY